MQRYFLNNLDQIQKDDCHHIKHVMRMKTGDEIEVCDLKGQCFLANLRLENDSVYYDRKAVLNTSHRANHITLIQGIGKGDKNEFVIKYATQFGVDHIIFVEMKRSISKIDQPTWDKKKDRYRSIAEESARLAHRNLVPEISFLTHLKLLDMRFDHRFVAFENDRNTPFVDKIAAIKAKESIALLIGPEGGIDDSEMALLSDKSFVSIGLGERILQTEVACLYGLSLLDALLERKR